MESSGMLSGLDGSEDIPEFTVEVAQDSTRESKRRTASRRPKQSNYSVVIFGDSSADAGGPDNLFVRVP
jgi:hypothetical protein